MVSTYSANSGIEKPASGSQSGTWGDTVNTNMDIIDRVMAGVGSISLSGTTHTLTTSDGSLSDGHYRVLVLGGTPSGTNTITVSPNDQDKLYFVVNASGEDVVFSQGSGANVTVANGKTKIIYCDGAGSSAAVNDITKDLTLSGTTEVVTLSIGGTAVTSTAAELNLLDGSSAGTIVNSKGVVYGSSGEVNATTLQISGTDITSTAAELNLLDGSSAGTVANSKAVIYGSSGEVNATTLQIGGTSITATAAELNYVDGVTSNIQTQLDAKGTSITGAATTIVSSDLTADRALLSNSSGKVAVSDVTSTELGYLDGVTSAVQTQLNAKQATITGAATTIDDADLTASRAVISNASGKIAVSAVTDTELGYLDGVTSNIQTQLDSKTSSVTGAASTIVSTDLTADRALLSNSSGKVAVSDVTSTELGYLDGVTSSVQTQIDTKQAVITGAPSTVLSSNLSNNIVVVSNSSGKLASSSVSTTSLGYLDATSSIQTQIDSKQATITGAATSIDTENLTASRALVSDTNGKVAVSDVTSTEIGYLDGVTSNIQTQLNTISTVPAGVVSPYAGTSAPTGYLLCYGQTISRTTYATLFAAIGTTYGAGDGSTTFAIPDLRGRAVAGQDDMGGASADRLTNQSGGVDGDTLGASGGAETHTLTTAQIPAHTHTFQSDEPGKVSFAGLYEFLADNTPTNRTSSSTGGGGAHNNVQPTLILNYIIKT